MPVAGGEGEFVSRAVRRRNELFYSAIYISNMTRNVRTSDELAQLRDADLITLKVDASVGSGV